MLLGKNDSPGFIYAVSLSSSWDIPPTPNIGKQLEKVPKTKMNIRKLVHIFPTNNMGRQIDPAIRPSMSCIPEMQLSPKPTQMSGDINSSVRRSNHHVCRIWDRNDRHIAHAVRSTDSVGSSVVVPLHTENIASRKGIVGIDRRTNGCPANRNISCPLTSAGAASRADVCFGRSYITEETVYTVCHGDII